MPKIKRLSIPCDNSAKDTLIAVVAREGRMAITVKEQGEHCGIILTKDTARQLFNYLGVWLHTFRE